jgi:hypothetical protein
MEYYGACFLLLSACHALSAFVLCVFNVMLSFFEVSVKQTYYLQALISSGSRLKAMHLCYSGKVQSNGLQARDSITPN